MPNQYTPDKRTVGALLSMTNPPVVVPEWQRNYSWTSSEVGTFWHDLTYFGAKYPDDNIADQEYFLGSVVIVDNNVSHLLLDGQQRLATAAILLSVIRDYLARFNKDAAVRVSTRFLTDFDDALGKNTYKLTLNRYDRDFFKREVLESRTGDYQPMDPEIESHRLIRKARAFFEGKFEEQYASLGGGEEFHKWALRVLKVLTAHLSVVAVVSGDEDNAANVFETLNDRGIGLSTPDLLRNLVFRRADQNELEEIIDLWGEVLSIESDAKLRSFLRHYWISYEGDVKTQSLYREIKGKILSEDRGSLEFSRRLRDGALVYRDLVTANHENDGIVQNLAHIGTLNANALYPLMLSAMQKVDEAGVLRLSKALLTTYVRHTVIGGLENSQLETIVYSLAPKLRAGLDVDEAIGILRDFAPDDERFVATFEEAAVPRMATARYLLRELEQDQRNTEELDVAPPKRVHVEHIYPQTPKPGERWENHRSAINRIGNLTLLSARLNMAIRNSNFDDKKPKYDESELLLTNSLAQLEEWNEGQVAIRQQQLSKRAPVIWAYPD